MDLAVIVFVSGIAVLALLGAFLVAFYRIAGLRRTRLETRRWAFNFAWMGLLVAVSAAGLAAGMNIAGAVVLGLLVVGVPVFVASYALRGRHWLFTPQADEAQILESRREAIRAARRRPAFWLLVAAYALAVPAVSVALVLAFRDA